MKYQVLVRFDDCNCTDEERRIYFSALNKYNALGFGNSTSRTSTMFIASNSPLIEEILAQDLKGLEILSFRIDSLRRTRNIN